MAVMGSKKTHLIILLSILTGIFCIAIALDISPYLRGPAPYPPDWRWEYFFSNTWSKVWAPGFIILSILLGAFVFEKKSGQQLERIEWKMLLCFVFLSFLFQMSIVFFSRAGIFVLIHRIINPELNGYFTASLQIKDIGEFLHTYNERVLSLPMHATGHPPGAIIFFWIIEKIFSPFSKYLLFLNTIHITHKDVAFVWDNLSVSQKATAIFSAYFIPFLGSLSVIFIYYIGKLMYDSKTAVRASLLYICIPSVVLFIPINDVFLPLFGLSTFFFILKGIERKKGIYFLLSGLLFSVGIFFSISLAPLLVLFFIFSLFQSVSFKQLLKWGSIFCAGFLLFPLTLQYIYGYNTLTISRTLMTGLPKSRAYIVWVFYNLYDFFIFSGIPSFFIFISGVTKLIREKINIFDALPISFISMLLLLNFSGSVRGEVARIWLPFYPFLVLAIAYFLTKKLHLSTKRFVIILFLQCLQIIFMQEFWVMLW